MQRHDEDYNDDYYYYYYYYYYYDKHVPMAADGRSENKLEVI
jgi:hypothetical protein